MICLFHSIVSYISVYRTIKNKVGKGTHEPKVHTAGASIPVSATRSKPRSIATPPWMGCYSIAGLLPSSISLVPIYTPGCRKTKWSKVSCLRN